MSSVAFDAVASEYDDDFSHSALGQMLRARLWTILEAEMPAHGRLLELGCGTGEDAVHLSRRGATVLATDQSTEMLMMTKAKAAGAGVSVQTQRLDLEAPTLDDSDQGRRFDGAWSSFGPLNCVADRQPLWRFLAQHIVPGGVVVLVVMAPLTPWDWLWFGGHGQLRAATRRLRSGRVANAGAGGRVRVWYPSWRQLVEESGAAFHLRRVEGIGALLPISEASHLVTRFPRLFRLAARMERHLGRLPPWPSLCDHYALVLERTNMGAA